MKYEQLKYFKELARIRNFTQVADNMYISQSSLSKSIASLETELGGELFDRQNNGMRLSEYGEYLEEYIYDIIDSYDRLSEAAENYFLLNHKRLCIAVSFNVTSTPMYQKILNYEASRDDFYMETTECNSDRMDYLMSAGKIETCLSYLELTKERKEYSIHRLYKDPVILVTSRQTAERNGWGDMIRFADARDERFYFPREDRLYYIFCRELCKKAGFQPQLTLSNVRLPVMQEYIRRGERSTLLPESIAKGNFDAEHYALIRLKENPMLTLTYFVRKKDAERTAIREFTAFMDSLTFP